MPFTSSHYYMTVIGDAYGATDRWQFGLRMTQPAAPPGTDVVVNGLWDDVSNWWTKSVGAGLFPSNTHRLTEVKVAWINIDGKYPSNFPSASHFFLPPIAGAGTPPAGQVAQNTAAVTLTTAVPRGLAAKGRCFLPPNANLITATDGRMATTQALNLAQSVWDLIKGINADPNVGDVVVMSRGRRLRGPAKPNGQPTYTYPNPGATNIVTGVSCGRVIDTQRRRRRSLIEANVAAAP